jgi:hypothetical protein
LALNAGRFWTYGPDQQGSLILSTSPFVILRGAKNLATLGLVEPH